MKNPGRDDLIKQLKTPGWKLDGGRNGTLEDAVRAAHARHAAGEEPGLVSRMETALELDLIQLQELWVHLGLPM
jgi:hypothetical protein